MSKFGHINCGVKKVSYGPQNIVSKKNLIGIKSEAQKFSFHKSLGTKTLGLWKNVGPKNFSSNFYLISVVGFVFTCKISIRVEISKLDQSLAIL